MAMHLEGKESSCLLLESCSLWRVAKVDCRCNISAHELPSNITCHCQCPCCRIKLDRLNFQSTADIFTCLHLYSISIVGKFSNACDISILQKRVVEFLLQ